MADITSSLNPDTKEGVGEVQDYFTIDDSDTDLVRMINRKIKTSKEYEAFKKEGKTNERYWNRDHLQSVSLRWHQSRIIQNVIYVGVETMVPIMTSKPAEPMISVAGMDQQTNEEVREFTDLLEKVLLNKYYDEDYPQQALIEMLARHLLLYKVGAAKIMWNETIDDYLVEYVHPHKIVFEPEGYYNQDICVPQYLERSLNDLIEMFPEKKEEIIHAIFPGVEVSLSEYGDTPIGLWEYWPEDGEYVVWKMQNVILQKKLNPNLVWKNDKTFDKVANHFDYPHKPYIFLNSQNLGKHIWDDTTPVTQCIPIQDGINLMQRILTDTARDQGILVGASEFIDRDELYKYTGAPDDKLSVKGGDAQRALYRVPPKQLATFVENNLLHLIQMADNIMGTHSTTRGERSNNNTLGQDQLAKESDYGRIDQLVRGLERMCAEIYNWEVQMMLVKYTPEHYSRILGQEKGQRLFELMKKYNEVGIKIVVKAGSTLPTDKNSQRAEAIELAKMNKLSDIDLFERMDFPNPQQLAENVFLQMAAPLILYPNVIQKMNAMPMVNLPPIPRVREDLNIDIPYEKAPPDVQRQIEQKAGFQPSQMPAHQPDQAQIVQQQNQQDQQAQQQAQAQSQPAPTQQPAQPAPDQQAAQPDMGQQPMQQPPMQGQVPPEQAQQPQPGQHLDHIAMLIQGQDVPPFAGIDPKDYQQHLQEEFSFMASDQFLQLPQELQVKIAQHVITERDMVSQQGTNQDANI